MNKIKIFFLLLLSTSIISCDDFLNINPKAEVVNDDMFNSAEGCEDALTGIYGELKVSALYGENLSWKVPDILAQDLSTDKNSEFGFLGFYTYSKTEGILYNMFKSAYEVIGHTNNAIQNFESHKNDGYPMMNVYLGEAYAIRAMLHFDILRLYAPHVETSGSMKAIPYVKNYNFNHTPFSTVDQCYEAVLADLTKAQGLLVSDIETITYPRMHYSNVKEAFMRGREMHLNYYAVTALLARVYWTKGDYEKAKVEALKVIDSEKFPLCTADEIKTLIAGSLSPKESIFGIYSTDYFDVVSRNFKSYSSYSLVPFYTNWNVVSKFPVDDIYKKDVEANSGTDARFTNWIVAIGSNPNYQSKLCHKLLDNIRVADENKTPTSRNLYEGISVLRIPEMYYIVSEVLLSEGDVAGAEKYINTVLESRGLKKLSSREPVVTLTKELIYNERHKEMYCEGQRWFDMKKLNMDVISNYENKVIPAAEVKYVLPIPPAETENRN